MRAAGVQHLLGALHRHRGRIGLRALLGLDRRSVVVGAVGSGYSSADGIDLRWLAH